MAGKDVRKSARLGDLTTHVGLALPWTDRAVIHHQLAISGNGNPGTGAILLAFAFAGKFHFPAELSVGGDLAGAAPGLIPIETVAALDAHAVGAVLVAAILFGWRPEPLIGFRRTGGSTLAGQHRAHTQNR